MQTYCLAFWNVENLFAPEVVPQREPWLAERVGGHRGLVGGAVRPQDRAAAGGIAAMNAGAGPDLVAVSEVEDRFVPDRLTRALRTALPDRGYGVVHADWPASP